MCVPELNIGTEEEPIGARFTEWHSDTSGVHNSSCADHPIKLHVGVTADYGVTAQSLEERQKSVFWSEASEDVGVIARCSMAENHVSKAGNF